MLSVMLSVYRKFLPPNHQILNFTLRPAFFEVKIFLYFFKYFFLSFLFPVLIVSFFTFEDFSEPLTAFLVSFRDLMISFFTFDFLTKI